MLSRGWSAFFQPFPETKNGTPLDMRKTVINVFSKYTQHADIVDI